MVADFPRPGVYPENPQDLPSTNNQEKKNPHGFIEAVPLPRLQPGSRAKAPRTPSPQNFPPGSDLPWAWIRNDR